MARYTLKQMEKALTDSKGMVYLASKQLGCSYNTVRRWMETHPRLQEIVEAEDGQVTDTAELKLFQAIMKGEPWAISYRLGRKGRDRGYGESLTLNGNKDQPILIKVVYDRPGLETSIEGEFKPLPPASNGIYQPVDEKG